MARRLRMGLIGGGGTGFIGRVHALAAQLDGRAELVAGAFSSVPERSRQAAAEFRVAPERAYDSWSEMLRRECELPSERRIDVVSIATPNNTHFEIAAAALRAGFHVCCEKPLATSVDDARQLVDLVRSTGLTLSLLHNYSGYPLVRQAREMIAAGELGEVQAVRVNYIQGGLRRWAPGVVPTRGVWKSDPALAGPAGTLADIGTHAFHLSTFVTGLLPVALQCRLATFTPERRLDDYGQVWMRYSHGALGSLVVSQVTHGRLNDLTLEIDGTRASLVWRQEEPNQLIVRRFGEPTRTYDRNPTADYATPSARAACRIPAGHPEAFLEAFANVFRDAFDRILVREAAGGTGDGAASLAPTAEDGLRGTQFVRQALTSHVAEGSVVAFPGE